MSSQASALVRYGQTVWRAVVSCTLGLGVTLKHLFSRPVTVEYPKALPDVPEGWRGWHAYETDRCTMCRLCEQVCPVQCIRLEVEGKGKERKLVRYEIHYGLCLFCNLCAEVCPTACLWMTADWDLACYRRADCTIRFHETNPDEQRKRLWPGMKDLPARAPKKPRETAPAEKAQNP